MPVKETLTEKIEVLSEFKIANREEFERGTLTEVAFDATSGYDNSGLPVEGQLTLKKFGKDFILEETTQTDFMKYKSMTNLTWTTKNGITGLTTVSGQTTGNRVIEIDLTKMSKHASAIVYWEAYYSGFVVEVSHDNGTTWSTIGSGSEANGGEGLQVVGLTVDQDVNNKKILIRQRWTSGSPVLNLFKIEFSSSFKRSGSWITPIMPLSDKGITTISGYPKYSTYATAWENTTLTVQYSIDGGKTWSTYSGWTTAIKNAKFIQYKFNLSTTNPQYSPKVHNFENKYWSNIPASEAQTIIIDSDKIKEFNFRTEAVRGIDATWDLLTDMYALQRQVKYTQTVGSVTKTIVGRINGRPRTIRVPGYDVIDVTCFDLGHPANKALINENFPLYDVNIEIEERFATMNGYPGVIGTTDVKKWHQIVAYAWSVYGDKAIELNYAVGAIETCNLPVVEIGSRFRTLYDLMDTICTITDWTWELDGYKLRFYERKNTTPVTELIQDVNVVGTPQINDNAPEIINSVTIPTSTKVRDFEDVQDIINYGSTYDIQYFPIITQFQRSDGTQVIIDPEPRVFKLVNGTYSELVTYAEGYEPKEATETEPAEPAAEAWYNVDMRKITLVNPPTTNIKNGLKVIYNCEIYNVIIREDRESVRYFGKQEMFVSTQYRRDEAENTAKRLLDEKAFPVQPITLETTEFSYRIGDYVMVRLYDQGIEQIMPVTQIETTSTPDGMDIKITLNKAPVTDTDLIVDLFNRLKNVERKTVENELTLAKYPIFEDDVEVEDEVFFNGTYQWEV